MRFSQTHIFFVGIGGIGMSALARYFKNSGKVVGGYDKTSTELSKELENEDIEVIYEDTVSLIPDNFLIQHHCLVIYTPAIPRNNSILKYFEENNFNPIKRAQALGEISKDYKTIAVAGTHGKTTISSLIAHLLHASGVRINALLGGISLNFQSNMLWKEGAEILVTEADEYDRSFLQLHPDIAVITSVDADHLDIYGEEAHVLESFQLFAGQVSKRGILISKAALFRHFEPGSGVKTLSYSFGEKTDYAALNVHISNGEYVFDLDTPKETVEEMECGLPGRHNVENAIAALAVCLELGVDAQKLKTALVNFKGVHRRFDLHYKKGNKIYIDDYAHHPTEIRVLIRSVRELYPHLKLTGIFQPHLYSRTRDFADDFAESLSLLDELILLDIYPAREEPIEGITAQWLLDKISMDKKQVSSLTKLPDLLRKKEFEVLLSIGAGNIDSLVEPIKKLLQS